MNIVYKKNNAIPNIKYKIKFVIKNYDGDFVSNLNYSIDYLENSLIISKKSITNGYGETIPVIVDDFDVEFNVRIKGKSIDSLDGCSGKYKFYNNINENGFEYKEDT